MFGRKRKEKRTWEDTELRLLLLQYREAFPESTWHIDGCGITPDEAKRLAEASLDTKYDILSPTYHLRTGA